MIRETLALLVLGASLTSARAARAQETLSYGADPAQVLDVYPGQGPRPHELVIVVHGGGWQHGDRRGGRLAAGYLNRLGYTVASIDYRLNPPADGTAQAEDVAHAAAFLVKHAANVGIDPRGFALMGHSAGGHLVALLGTDAHYLTQAGLNPAQLKAVITLDGVFDLPRYMPKFSGRLAAALFGPKPQDWARFSPVQLVPGMTAHPLFCLMHEDTQPNFVAEADDFTAALRNNREHVIEGVAPGLNHGTIYANMGDPRWPIAGFIAQCLRQARL